MNNKKITKVIPEASGVSPKFQGIVDAWRKLYSDPHKKIMEQRRKLRQDFQAQVAEYKNRVAELRVQDKTNLMTWANTRDAIRFSRAAM